jgi:Na+/H+-dicarboxylate symporter
MLLILMVTSKECGVPRASLVVTPPRSRRSTFRGGAPAHHGHRPVSRHGRSATNVVGNSIATAVVAKWEGELRPESEAQAEIDADESIVAARA